MRSYLNYLSISIALISPFTSAFAEQSYQELEQVEAHSPQFPDALLELQKIHFKNQNWDQFFAYALFYRRNVMADQKSWEKNFRSRLYSLEILALSKHCLTEAAESVYQEGLAVAAQIKSKETVEIENAAIFAPPLKTFSQVRGTVQPISIPESILKQTNYWPIQNKFLQAVRHPKVLRVHVKSRCENENK